MIVLLLFIIVYILSFIGAYKYIQTSYSSNGQWKHINPEGDDFFMIIMPISNTMLTIGYFLGECNNENNCIIYKNIKNTELWNKFFKINKY